MVWEGSWGAQTSRKATVGEFIGSDVSKSSKSFRSLLSRNIVDVDWVTLQTNLHLHWTRRFLLFTPIWTHQEHCKKLHLGEGSIEQTQCALSSHKPWRANQWDLKVQCNLQARISQTSLLSFKWKKKKWGKMICCGSKIGLQSVPWCANLVWFLEVNVHSNLLFNLCRGMRWMSSECNLRGPIGNFWEREEVRLLKVINFREQEEHCTLRYLFLLWGITLYHVSKKFKTCGTFWR